MKYRRLGDSGPMVSAVALGTWNLYGPGISDFDTVEIISEALDRGITTFDTADSYGDGVAELLLGKALSKTPREAVVICTKVGLPFKERVDSGGLARRYVIDSCHSSLRRLGTDYIDLYQAHRFDPDTPTEETIAAFAQLVEQGSVRYIGISEWPPQEIIRAHQLACESAVPLVSNQCQYSMIWRVPEREVVPKGSALGIGHMAYSPLAQGALAGRYDLCSRFPEDSRAIRIGSDSSVYRYLSDELISSIHRLRPLVDSLGVTMAQLAIAWVLRSPRMSCAVVGASKREQLAESCGGADIELSKAALQQIDQILKNIVETDSSKAGRPYDVDVRWKRQADME